MASFGWGWGGTKLQEALNAPLMAAGFSDVPVGFVRTLTAGELPDFCISMGTPVR